MKLFLAIVALIIFIAGIQLGIRHGRELERMESNFMGDSVRVAP